MLIRLFMAGVIGMGTPRDVKNVTPMVVTIKARWVVTSAGNLCGPIMWMKVSPGEVNKDLF
jgi:hypothetical protein